MKWFRWVLVLAIAMIAGSEAAKAAKAEKAPASRDFYKILGIKKTAKEKEIKRGYHKMALKWHPDKNLDDKEAATKKFEEVALAYEILSDPEKKKIYDAYGEEGLKPGFGGGSEGGNPNDFQNQEFHFSGSPGGGFGGPGGGFGGPGGSFGGGNIDPFELFARMFGGGAGGPGGTPGGFGGFPQQNQHQAATVPDLYAEKHASIKKLKQDKFPDKKSQNVWLIQYYNSRDPRSEQFKAEFDKIAESVTKYDIRVGVVNCESDQKLCSSLSVSSFPSVSFAFAGNNTLIPGKLSGKSILEYIKENHPGTVKLIRTVDHLEQLSKTKGKEINGFLTLWTSKFETSLQLKALAYKNRKVIDVAEARGSNEKLGQAFGVTQFPTLTYTCPGNNYAATELYTGDLSTDLTSDAIDKFIKQYKDGKKCREMEKKLRAKETAALKEAQQALSLSKVELMKKSVKDLGNIVDILKISRTGFAEKEDYVNAILARGKSTSTEL